MPSIPESGDNVPISSLRDWTELAPSIGTAAKDFDAPDDMLDENPDLGFTGVGELLQLGEGMVAFGFLIDPTVPPWRILRDGLIGTIRPHDHFAHQPEQLADRPRQPTLCEDLEVMDRPTIRRRQIDNHPVLGDEELQLATMALFFPE